MTEQTALNEILTALLRSREDDMIQHGEWKSRPRKVLTSHRMMMEIKSDRSILNWIDATKNRPRITTINLLVDGKLGIDIEASEELTGDREFKFEP